MSTVVPADVPCCVKQCHHYTPDGYSQHQNCISSVYFQSYPIPLGKYEKKLFHNSRLQSSRFMYNKKESSVLLVLLLVLLILLLPQPQPPALQLPQLPKKTTTTSIINNATTTTSTTETTTTTTAATTAGKLQQ
jgi:hypothetical protein